MLTNAQGPRALIRPCQVLLSVAGETPTAAAISRMVAYVRRQTALPLHSFTCKTRIHLWSGVMVSLVSTSSFFYVSHIYYYCPSHCCHTPVTLLSHRCHTAVTLVTLVTQLSHPCHTCHTAVTSLSHAVTCCHTPVTVKTRSDVYRNYRERTVNHTETLQSLQ